MRVQGLRALAGIRLGDPRVLTEAVGGYRDKLEACPTSGSYIRVLAPRKVC
jgi:hypothetical protein